MSRPGRPEWYFLPKHCNYMRPTRLQSSKAKRLMLTQVPPPCRRQRTVSPPHTACMHLPEFNAGPSLIYRMLTLDGWMCILNYTGLFWTNTAYCTRCLTWSQRPPARERDSRLRHDFHPSTSSPLRIHYTSPDSVNCLPHIHTKDYHSHCWLNHALT